MDSCYDISTIQLTHALLQTKLELAWYHLSSRLEFVQLGVLGPPPELLPEWDEDH